VCCRGRVGICWYVARKIGDAGERGLKDERLLTRVREFDGIRVIYTYWEENRVKDQSLVHDTETYTGLVPDRMIGRRNMR